MTSTRYTSGIRSHGAQVHAPIRLHPSVIAELDRIDDRNDADVLRIGLYSIVAFMAIVGLAIGAASIADRAGWVDMDAPVTTSAASPSPATDASTAVEPSSMPVGMQPSPVIPADPNVERIPIPDDETSFGPPGALVPRTDAHRLVQAHVVGDHAAVLDLARRMDWSTVPLDQVVVVALMIRHAEDGVDRCVESPATEQLGGCPG